MTDAARGVLAMIGSSVAVAIMAGLARYATASYGVDAYKIVMFRCAIGMAIVGTLAMMRSGEIRFAFGYRMLLRGIFGGAGLLAFFLGIAHLGVARGTIISYSSPIFVTIFGLLILKERVAPAKWAAVLLGFVGIVLITLDPAILKQGLSGDLLWYGVAIAGAVSGSLAVILIRQLRNSNKPTELFFAQAVVGFWLTLIPANLKPVELTVPGGLLIYSYARISVATGSVLTMTVPVLTTALGILIFREPLSPRVIVGSAIVVASCILVGVARQPFKRAVSVTPAETLAGSPR
jgi:drug/metabolite transporter (DMT)-like permease